MGPTDHGCHCGREKLRARKTADRKRWTRLELRGCPAVRKYRARRISQSARESRQPSRAVARRTRKGRPLRREDQLRVELGVICQFSAAACFAFARARLACNSAKCFSDQRQSARNGSINVRPSLESEYSTFGGTTG